MKEEKGNLKGCFAKALVTLVVSNAGGSDSITLGNYMRVNPAPVTPTITQVGNILFCSTDSSYTSYQWYDSAAMIPGATDTSLLINYSGNYNVQVTSANGCKVAVGITVIIGFENLYINKFELYPNPVNNQLTLSGLPAIGNKVVLEIFNVIGEQIYTSEIDRKDEIIDVSGFAQGVYYLRLKSNGESAVRKFIKE